MADKIEAALKGITDKTVKRRLNTHWHGTTLAVIAFWEKAPIVAARKTWATDRVEPAGAETALR